MATVDPILSARNGLTYSYTPIQKPSRDVRLLSLLPGQGPARIHCTLQTVSLNEKPHYEALSYTWGGLAINNSIFLDEIEVQVTTNLYEALRHLRKPDEARTLWVDALCINQQDDAEKSHQVRFMGEIYRQCYRVVIWLRCANPEMRQSSVNLRESADPFTFLHHLANGKHFYELDCFKKKHLSEEVSFTRNPSFDATWSGFLSIAQSLWWTRLWTVQEAVLAPEAILVYDHWHLSLAALLAAAGNYNNHAWGCCYKYLQAFPADMRHPLNIYGGNIHDLQSDRNVILGGRFCELYEQLLAYSHRGCKDPRDKIYGLLGLVEQKRYPGLVADYSLHAPAVFIQAAQAMLDAGKGDLKFLCGPGHGPKFGKLPSWIRDFADSVDRDMSGTEMDRLIAYGLYNTSAGRLCQYSINERQGLQLTGALVDTVKTICQPVSSRKWTDTKPVLLDWLKTAREQYESSKLPPIPEMGWQGSFWHTMIAGVFVDYDPQTHEPRRRRSTKVDMKLFEDWVAWVEQDRRDLDQAAVSTNWTAIFGRAFFLTEKGSMGLCHPNVSVADEVWVLHGGRVPFVLRRQGKNSEVIGARCRAFIGDCYLDGYMDGEAINSSSHSEEEITLC